MMRTLPEQLLYDLETGLFEAQIVEKHNLTVTEVRTLLSEAQTARRETLHNRVRATFLQGFTVQETTKYFGLTESEIRTILGL